MGASARVGRRGGSTVTADDYARCTVCRGMYRPAVEASAAAHATATGHRPTTAGDVPAPGTVRTERRVDPRELLGAALRRIADLQQCVTDVEAMATEWAQSPDAARRADAELLLLRLPTEGRPHREP